VRGPKSVVAQTASGAREKDDASGSGGIDHNGESHAAANKKRNAIFMDYSRSKALLLSDNKSKYNDLIDAHRSSLKKRQVSTARSQVQNNPQQQQSLGASGDSVDGGATSSLSSPLGTTGGYGILTTTDTVSELRQRVEAEKDDDTVTLVNFQLKRYRFSNAALAAGSNDKSGGIRRDSMSSRKGVRRDSMSSRKGIRRDSMSSRKGIRRDSMSSMIDATNSQGRDTEDSIGQSSHHDHHIYNIVRDATTGKRSVVQEKSVVAPPSSKDVKMARRRSLLTKNPSARSLSYFPTPPSSPEPGQKRPGNASNEDESDSTFDPPVNLLVGRRKLLSQQQPPQGKEPLTRQVSDASSGSSSGLSNFGSQRGSDESLSTRSGDFDTEETTNIDGARSSPIKQEVTDDEESIKSPAYFGQQYKASPMGKQTVNIGSFPPQSPYGANDSFTSTPSFAEDVREVTGETMLGKQQGGAIFHYDPTFFDDHTDSSSNFKQDFGDDTTTNIDEEDYLKETAVKQQASGRMNLLQSVESEYSDSEAFSGLGSDGEAYALSPPRPSNTNILKQVETDHSDSQSYLGASMNFDDSATSFDQSDMLLNESAMEDNDDNVIALLGDASHVSMNASSTSLRGNEARDSMNASTTSFRGNESHDSMNASSTSLLSQQKASRRKLKRKKGKSKSREEKEDGSKTASPLGKTKRKASKGKKTSSTERKGKSKKGAKLDPSNKSTEDESDTIDDDGVCAETVAGSADTGDEHANVVEDTLRSRSNRKLIPAKLTRSPPSKRSVKRTLSRKQSGSRSRPHSKSPDVSKRGEKKKKKDNRNDIPPTPLVHGPDLDGTTRPSGDAATGKPTIDKSHLLSAPSGSTFDRAEEPTTIDMAVPTETKAENTAEIKEIEQSRSPTAAKESVSSDETKTAENKPKHTESSDTKQSIKTKVGSEKVLGDIGSRRKVARSKSSDVAADPNRSCGPTSLSWKKKTFGLFSPKPSLSSATSRRLKIPTSPSPPSPDDEDEATNNKPPTVPRSWSGEGSIDDSKVEQPSSKTSEELLGRMKASIEQLPSAQALSSANDKKGIVKKSKNGKKRKETLKRKDDDTASVQTMERSLMKRAPRARGVDRSMSGNDALGPRKPFLRRFSLSSSETPATTQKKKKAWRLKRSKKPVVGDSGAESEPESAGTAHQDGQATSISRRNVGFPNWKRRASN